MKVSNLMPLAARPTSGESVERAPIRSVLEEEDDEEEPPRILLYHGKVRGAGRGG